MNVLQLVNSFHPVIGGVEKHVLRVSEEMAAMGHGVTVVSQRLEPEWAAEEMLGEVRVVRLPHRPGWRVLRATLSPLVEQAHVLHAHDAYALLRWHLPVKRVLPRRPAVITFHGYEGYPIPLQARILRRLAERVTVGSACMGEFICKWYRTGCDLVSYGAVDMPAEVPDPPTDAGALYVGRLAADSGIVDVMETLRLLRQEHGLSLGLTVCGGGPLRDRLEQMARESELEVRFLGPVADVAPHLLQARYAFVTGYLAMLEAMASRRLVFAIYDNPLKRDYLTMFPAADAIVIAGSPEELARRVAEHLRQPERVAALLDRAETYAREQTWRKVAELYLQLYHKHGGSA